MIMTPKLLKLFLRSSLLSGSTVRSDSGRPESLVFFDLNDFKRTNDEHGHQAGDACLRRFAEALADSFRPGDAVVRYVT